VAVADADGEYPIYIGTLGASRVFVKTSRSEEAAIQIYQGQAVHRFDVAVRANDAGDKAGQEEAGWSKTLKKSIYRAAMTEAVNNSSGEEEEERTPVGAQPLPDNATDHIAPSPADQSNTSFVTPMGPVIGLEDDDSQDFPELEGSLTAALERVAALERKVEAQRLELVNVLRNTAELKRSMNLAAEMDHSPLIPELREIRERLEEESATRIRMFSELRDEARAERHACDEALRLVVEEFRPVKAEIAELRQGFSTSRAIVPVSARSEQKLACNPNNESRHTRPGSENAEMKGANLLPPKELNVKNAAKFDGEQSLVTYIKGLFWTFRMYTADSVAEAWVPKSALFFSNGLQASDFQSVWEDHEKIAKEEGHAAALRAAARNYSEMYQGLYMPEDKLSALKEDQFASVNKCFAAFQRLARNCDLGDSQKLADFRRGATKGGELARLFVLKKPTAFSQVAAIVLEAAQLDPTGEDVDDEDVNAVSAVFPAPDQNGNCKYWLSGYCRSGFVGASCPGGAHLAEKLGSDEKRAGPFADRIAKMLSRPKNESQ